MTTFLEILLVWMIASVPISLFVGWGLARANRDVPLASRPLMPQHVMQVDFTSTPEVEEVRKVGS